MIGRKILLIDDDPDFLNLIGLIFKEAGAQTFMARDGLEGMGKLLTQKPDLIVLDIMMPGMDGFTVCQRMRQFSTTPLILLSALDEDQLMLQGLEAGADDVLSKPVSPEILLARAKALIRRSKQKVGEPAIFNYDDGRMVIDLEKHRVLIGAEEVKLTPVEFRLLAFLVANAGRVLAYEQILFNVWGSEYQENADYVHVYISYLRGKIEPDPRKPRYISSIHGIGYVFEKPRFVKALSPQKVANHPVL